MQRELFCCDFAFRARKREYFVPLVLADAMGKKMRIVIRDGKFTREVIGEGETAAGGEATLGARKAPVPAAKPAWRIYERGYPDETPEWKPPAPPPGKRQKTKEEPPREKYPGTYFEQKRGTWYLYCEDGLRYPVEGRPFWHPHLQQVVYPREDGMFTDADGEVIRERQELGAETGPVEETECAGEAPDVAKLPRYDDSACLSDDCE